MKRKNAILSDFLRQKLPEGPNGNILQDSLIRIGLNEQEKMAIVDAYLAARAITKVYVLYWKEYKPEFEVGIEIEYIEWKDIIEYPFFYRLLEEITNDALIIVNECLRTQNRSELTYNCAHHYLNQTRHKIIFEYFPFIEDVNDFMILLDFLNKSKYKGKGFTWDFLDGEDIKIKPNPITFTTRDVPITTKEKDKYSREKEHLFDTLGNKDPDTIPRALHVLAGDFKKKHLNSTGHYIARNSRLKLSNVETYQKFTKPANAIIDFPHRRLDMNDYLKSANINEITFINSGLPVDEYYVREFKDWLDRLGEFSARAKIF